MGVVIKRFDMFLVTLDPTVGHEIQKTRPCVVVSPDEINRIIGTVIVAPMTKGRQSYPTRVPLSSRSEREAWRWIKSERWINPDW